MKSMIPTTLVVISFAGTLLGIAFNTLELPLFAVSVTAFLLLIAGSDYAPPRRHRHAAAAVTAAQRLPLAA